MSGGPDSDPLRSVALAALSTLLTAVGHVAGGGALPDLGLLLVLFPLLAGLFVTIAERCRGLAGTIATLAAGQLALHQLMVLMHPAFHLSEPAVPAGTVTLGMHAAVTLVLAGALRRADRAVAAVLQALRHVVPRRLAPPAADRPLPTRAVPGPGVPARLARSFSVAHVRRGPPVGC